MARGVPAVPCALHTGLDPYLKKPHGSLIRYRVRVPAAAASKRGRSAGPAADRIAPTFFAKRALACENWMKPGNRTYPGIMLAI
jgi:hypothetical protein